MTNVRRRTHDSVDKIMDKAESMRESGNEKMAYLKEKAMVVKENVDGGIRKNPKRSVLIAAGIGAVAGATAAAIVMRKKHQT